MNLLKLFQTKSRSFYFFLVLLSLVSSLTNIGMLMVINLALGNKALAFFGENTHYVFIGMVLLSFFTNYFFQNYMVELTNSILYRLELSILDKTHNASFNSFEKVGPDRIYSSISDARILSRVPETFVAILNAGVTLICCLVYLFGVSLLGGITVLALMVSLLLFYLYRNRQIDRNLNKVRDLQDGYYKSIRELLIGFKQIRVSTRRNKNLFDNHIMANRDKAKALSNSVSKGYVINELTGVYSWYVILGFIIFALPLFYQVDKVQMTSYITTVLFMMSPVAQLLMFVPSYTQFRISLNRINKLDSELVPDAVPVDLALVPDRKFDSIRFENLVYSYNASDASAFKVEIDNLELRKGEVVFVVGGNGSGKSTFINLLTGLCKADSGKVFINGEESDWEKVSLFSNNMAVVYTDQYIFEENYDEFDISEGNPRVNNLIDFVNLNGVLKRKENNTWFKMGLSKGQRKRVSLLLALLEEKPILILDEWAAEQDPRNRRLFYTEWLPAIKKMGITVIAVSHDDDYYHLADRVVKFNYGRVVSAASQVEEHVTA